MDLKVLAAVLIVIIIVETTCLFSIVWIFRLKIEAIRVEAEMRITEAEQGSKMLERETKCQMNICMPYEAYRYDEATRLCYCYEGHEVVKEVKL